jgi:MFS family permease
MSIHLIRQFLATFLISRLLTGAAGSGFISVAGGTISDIFGSTEVGMSHSLDFSRSFCFVNDFAPISRDADGGVYREYLHWTWIRSSD